MPLPRKCFEFCPWEWCILVHFLCYFLQSTGIIIIHNTVKQRQSRLGLHTPQSSTQIVRRPLKSVNLILYLNRVNELKRINHIAWQAVPCDYRYVHYENIREISEKVQETRRSHNKFQANCLAGSAMASGSVQLIKHQSVYLITDMSAPSPAQSITCTVYLS